MKVSYDFDDCLAEYKPSDAWTMDGELKPIPKVVNALLKDHAKGYEIYILSFRHGKDKEEIVNFCDDWKIPVKLENIICTESKPKSGFINLYGIEIHYDDRIDACLDISKNTNCFVFLVWEKNKKTNSTSELFHKFYI